MDDLVIDFKADGTVTALHMDAFDLGFLGPKDTRRQTDIVFDGETQLWNLVYIQGGREYFRNEQLNGFATYEEARKAEVRWLNNCRYLGIEPTNPAGVRIMAGIRKHG